MRSRDGVPSRTFTEGARRAQIVECAVDVIAENGYPAASVRAIAQRVGVAMSVVLYHFANKDSLVEAVVGEIYRSAISIIEPALASEETPRRKLRAYIHANIDYLDSHRRQQQALMEIATGFRSSDGRRIDALEVDPSILAALGRMDPTTFLTEGIRTGEFHGFDPQPMSIALRSALNGAVLELSRDPDFDVAEYGETVQLLFERAIGASDE